MRLRNITPHEIVLVGPGGGRGGVGVVLASEGVARVATEAEQLATVTVAGIALPVVRETLGAVTGLPNREPGTLLIVSRMVADACGAGSSGRGDVVSPGALVRDPAGKVVGCAGLVSPGTCEEACREARIERAVKYARFDLARTGRAVSELTVYAVNDGYGDPAGYVLATEVRRTPRGGAEYVGGAVHAPIRVAVRQDDGELTAVLAALA